MSYHPYGDQGYSSTAANYGGSNPPTPQDLSPPAAYPQWETLDQQDLQMQHSPLDTPLPTPSAFHPMQLEDPPHMVPTQLSTIHESPAHHQQIVLEPAPQNPGLLLRPSSRSGAVRSTPSRHSTRTSATNHPYYRAPPTTTPAAGPSTQAPPKRPSSAQGKRSSVRFSNTQATGMLPRPNTRAAAAAAATTPAPASYHSPQTQQPGSAHSTPQTPQMHQFPSTNAPRSHSSNSPQVQAPAPTQRPHQPLSPPRRRHTGPIPADMHYSETDNILNVSLELPGVTLDMVRVTLGTCYFNHVKYVGVTAETIPPFGPPEWPADVVRAVRTEMELGISATAAEREKVNAGRIVNPNLRERRFGIMRRMIQVPPHTTMRDVQASLKDGVLTLRVYCGKPYDIDDEQEVPVRLG